MSKIEENAGDLSARALGVGVGKIIKLTEDLYIAGQISEAQIEGMAECGGIKSIMNLRRDSEGSFLHTEAALCEKLGIVYHHVPMVPTTTTTAVIDELLVKLDTMAKPALVHCASAMRAGAVAVAHAATRAALSADGLEMLAVQTPFGRTTNQAFRSLIREYAADRVDMIRDLPDVMDINDDVVVGPQLSKEHLLRLKEERGIKTVINLRDTAEAGSLGLGVLANERELVEAAGVVYINIPTTSGEVPSEEEIAAAAKALEDAVKPVFMHCKRMRRTAAVVRALGLHAMPEVPMPATAATKSKAEADSAGTA